MFITFSIKKLTSRPRHRHSTIIRLRFDSYYICTYIYVRILLISTNPIEDTSILFNIHSYMANLIRQNIMTPVGFEPTLFRTGT